MFSQVYKGKAELLQLLTSSRKKHFCKSKELIWGLVLTGLYFLISQIKKRKKKKKIRRQTVSHNGKAVFSMNCSTLVRVSHMTAPDWLKEWLHSLTQIAALLCIFGLRQAILFLLLMLSLFSNPAGHCPYPEYRYIGVGCFCSVFRSPMWCPRGPFWPQPCLETRIDYDRDIWIGHFWLRIVNKGPMWGPRHRHQNMVEILRWALLIWGRVWRKPFGAQDDPGGPCYI